ncbi:hypothetical protein RchiOBHm_Chr3g0452791 [Rosa chinensis]|uniref:Uncharacterized protein n=1 Tax=Rosa chinensis TaxID=74649 RepID=A0A2P6R6F0_ROSCH|nr:hypothetical protein RchiOBHm_Chr3g0452791 [Rosa chinensis]
MMHGNAKMLAFPVSEAETGRKRVGNARKRVSEFGNGLETSVSNVETPECK